MGNLKLTIDNFQSIEHAQLEFVPGINIIVGQSNSGKTAILRAISALLTNPSYGKTFIKHNETKATVKCEYGGVSCSWSKSAKGGTVYNVNGEEYSKVGTSDITAYLPKSGFVVDGGNVANIEGEWDIPFPFGLSPAETFQVFENVFCVSDSTTILQSYKEEEAELSKKKTDLTAQIAEYTRKKTALEELEKDVDIAKIKKELSQFEEHAQDYFKLRDDIDSIEKSTVLEKLNIDEVLPPENNSLQDWISCYKDLKQLLSIHERSKFFNSLPEVMEVPETVNEYIDCKRDYDILQKASQADNFKLDREIEINEELLNRYLTLREDLRELELIKNADKFDISGECSLDSSLTLPQYIDVRTDFTTVVNCYKKCKSLKEKGEELDKKIKEIESKLKKYDICPLCGQPLNGGIHAE